MQVLRPYYPKNVFRTEINSTTVYTGSIIGEDGDATTYVMRTCRVKVQVSVTRLPDEVERASQWIENIYDHIREVAEMDSDRFFFIRKNPQLSLWYDPSTGLHHLSLMGRFDGALALDIEAELGLPVVFEGDKTPIIESFETKALLPEGWKT